MKIFNIIFGRLINLCLHGLQMAETIHTDTFLSNFATAYNIEGYVADFVAPPFKVKRPSDKYAEYDKTSQRVYENKVAGRARAKEINWNVSSSTYSCERYKLAFGVEDQIAANSDNPIDLKKDATKQVKKSQALAREYRISSVVTNASVITQTVDANGDWNNKTNGTPVADILTGMKTIYQSTGMQANRIIIPYSVAIEAIKTDEWLDYFKYTGDKSLWNLLSGLTNLGLQGKIAGSFGLSTYENTASDPAMEELYGENVIIFYAEAKPTLQTRTFMYSPYTYMNRMYVIREEREETTYYEIREEIDELLVDATCAYLITNTLT